MSYLDKTWQDKNILKCLQNSKRLQTIFSSIEGIGPTTESFIDVCLSRFKYLQIIDLSDSCFEVLPSSIGNMKHLSGIDLSRNRRIQKLPKSICKLQNL